MHFWQKYHPSDMHYSEHLSGVNFDHLVKKVLWVYPASIMVSLCDTKVNKMVSMLLMKHSSIMDKWCSSYHCHVTPLQELVALSHIFIVLNRFCGSGIWKDIARMACFSPMMPTDSAEKPQMAGSDETAENQNHLQACSLTWTDMTQMHLGLSTRASTHGLFTCPVLPHSMAA